MNFYKNNLKVKTLCLLLIVIFTASPLMLALPEKAEADVPVVVTAITDPDASFYYMTMDDLLVPELTATNATTNTSYDIWDKIWENIAMPMLQKLAKLAAMALIQNIVQSTINWIKSGFQGNPSFVGNPGGLLKNTADQAIGEMIFRDPSLNFLCAPFQLQVKLALGLQFQDFSKKINCTLSGVINNVSNAVNGASVTLNGNTVFQGNKFIASGGWDNWIQMTSQPQNNSTGAFLIAKSELDSRIADKQNQVSAELNWGTGALSFKSCTTNSYDANGNQIGTPDKFIGSPSYDPKENTFDNSNSRSSLQEGGAVSQNTSCEVATPGAIITSELGFQADSNQRMGEYQAALANGLDQILSALAGEILQMAISNLTQGILGGGSSNANNSNYTNSLNAQFQKAQQDYNNQINSVSTTTIGDTNMSQFTNSYDQFAGQGYSSNFDTSTYTPPSGASMNPTNNSTSDPLYTQRQNALTRIGSLTNSENQYQNNLMNVLNLLTKGKVVFVSAEKCDAKYGTASSTQIASQINVNVVTNIDGTPNIYRTLANIPWNFKSISMSTTTSNANLGILYTAKNNVSVATTSQGIVDALTMVNSTDFNTDPQASTTDYVGTWLRGVRDLYTTSYCPINLTSVFATSTATTTAR